MSHYGHTYDVSTGSKRRRHSFNEDTALDVACKRPRTGTTRKKLRISMLQEIPLELIFEILQYLEPSDLLKLAWVNKDFRSLLMSRPSTFLWRRARINADDMPEPAFDMSEPSHARLIFVNHCSYCQTRCEKIIWECRIRCCKKCMRVRFINLSRALQMYYRLPYLQQMISFTPKQSQGLLFVDVLEQYSAELRRLEGNAEAIEQWLNLKLEQCNRIKLYIAACAQWEARRKRRQQIEQQIARLGRIEWIEEKSVAEGWQIEVERYRATHRGRSVGTVACDKVDIRKKSKSDLVERDWYKVEFDVISQTLERERKFLLGQAMHRRLEILHKVYTRLRSFNPGNPTLWPSPGAAEHSLLACL
ncbi:hypothetical protein F5878DRAFT_378873 [Lentinula raphanica]|uniref:F-box domain-containing protein n=1 Tax=Lentinula raphanica TaxID=153919 RepID=A0AA38P0K6_9AGAR|nr:hypothetical protein F5878DRAFT_378873 [Lentinula raphanica]